jgi:hypothetical protein
MAVSKDKLNTFLRILILILVLPLEDTTLFLV